MSLPALGYKVYSLTEKGLERAEYTVDHTRTHDFGDGDLILENEHVKAVFDSETMLLKSYTDKENGEELVVPMTGAFTLTQENPRWRATAWIVGESMLSQNLNRTCPVHVAKEQHTALVQSVSYSLPFGHGSKLDVTITLNADDRFLRYSVSCDFRETGDEHATPLLGFAVKQKYKAKQYRYDIPYGLIDRGPIAHDVAAESFLCAPNENSTSLMLTGSPVAGSILSITVRGDFRSQPSPE